MATVKQVVGAKAALTFASAFSTLAAATYTVSSVKDNTANQPLDNIVEVSAATTNTPSGNTQVVVFAQASYDGGTTWQSGPTSGTTTTDEPVLTLVGFLTIKSTGVTEVKAFSVAAAYGGVLPPTVRIVLKNDLGVALTSGTAAIAEVSTTVS